MVTFSYFYSFPPISPALLRHSQNIAAVLPQYVGQQASARVTCNPFEQTAMSRSHRSAVFCFIGIVKAVWLRPLHLPCVPTGPDPAIGCGAWERRVGARRLKAGRRWAGGSKQGVADNFLVGLLAAFATRLLPKTSNCSIASR